MFASPPYLQHMFYTNEPPDNSTATAVREIIDNSCAKMRTLMKNSTLQRDLQRTINHHRQILSPIRRLPTEILCEIFMAVKRDPSKLYIHDLDPRTGPWILGRVCRRWRDIALNVCWSLWTTLDVILTTPSGHWSEKHASNVLREYVRRSGGQPLAVSLMFSYRRPLRADEIPGATQYLDVIIGESPRWKSLYLHVSGRLRMSEWIMASLARVREHTALLEHIDFANCRDLYDLDVILQSAPRICDVTTSFHLNRGRVPWHQLTRYVHVSDSHVVDYAWIWANAPNLVECVIDAAVVEPGQSTGRVVHDNLRRLEVGTAEGLNGLTAPFLEQLVAPHCDLHLPPFLRRSPCLRAISLQGPFGGEDFLRMAANLKEVETLALIDVDLDDTFVEVLGRMSKVQSLDMECSISSTAGHGSLLEMLEGRQRNGLKACAITVYGDVPGKTWDDCIKCLRGNGINIEFV